MNLALHLANPEATVALLRKARELISDPDRWTCGSYARDAGGDPAEPWESEACRFCAYGAVMRFRERDGRSLVQDADYALTQAARARGSAVVKINDDGGHAAVLSLYDDAIALAGAANKLNDAGRKNE